MTILSAFFHFNLKHYKQTTTNKPLEKNNNYQRVTYQSISNAIEGII
jgi:hypothetical protein